MSHSVRPTVFAPFRSPFIALITGIFFGPIGLLYSSFVGSIVMFLLFLLMLAASQVLSIFWLILLWIVCIYWNVQSTHRYNQRLFRQFNVNVSDEKPNA